MAEEFLDDMNDDLEDAMEDILEDFSEETFEEALDEFPEDHDGEEKRSISKSLPEKLNGLLKKVLGSKKLIIITVSGLVLLALITVGAFIFFFSSNEETAQSTSKAKVQVDGTQGTEPVVKEIIFEDIVDLEPFERIALKSSSSMRLVSINLSLELIDHRYRKQVYSLEERIRKIITDQVAEMTWLELRNPEGKIMLKYNLLKRINSIFPKATVRNIYFTNFVMQ